MNERNRCFIAPPKDALRLAEGVKYIYKHPAEMEGVIEKNRERVLSFYERKSLHQAYRDIYHEYGLS